MDFSQFESLGANPMQIMTLLSQFGPKIPELINKVNTFIDAEEKKHDLKPDELIFHSYTRDSKNRWFLFGFVMKQSADKIMYVSRKAYSLDITEWIEKIKMYTGA